MKKISLLGLIFCVVAFSCKKEGDSPAGNNTGTPSGIKLTGSIGLSALPLDADSICAIPLYIDPDGTYETNAYAAGSAVPDFTLYKSDGTPVNLRNLLEAGKPVLLISGSYTCPVFRNKLPAINNLPVQFGTGISTYIVYIVEPHPIVDKSPYKDQVWTTNNNYNDSVLYEQHKTYAERKYVAAEMVARETVNVELLMDGPCNEWWTNFGEAPNRAYLLRKDGTVYASHGWYDPPSMVTSINALLSE